MTGYELSRKYHDWVNLNLEKVKPIHGALFFFIIELCNQLGWKEKFALPTYSTMEIIGVKNWRTYSKALNDLVEFGFIKLIEKSKNQYTANVITIVKNTEAKTIANTEAEKSYCKKYNGNYNSNINSIAAINKPNKTDINLKKLKNDFENFRKIFPGTKRCLDTEFANLKNRHKDYKEIIPNLEIILKKQIEKKENLFDSGEFVPNWKNLKTWINQRCWEDEIPEPKINGKQVLAKDSSSW